MTAVGERPWHRAYDPPVPAELALDPRTVPEFLAQSADTWPEAPALIFFNRRISYRALRAAVEGCAAGLAAHGVARGDRVAIHLPNLPQTVIAYHAVLSIGAVAVMTNPLYVEREIEHQWNDAGCTTAVTTDALFAHRLRAIRGALPVERYVVTAIPDYMPWPIRPLARWRLGRRRPPQVAPVREADGLLPFDALVGTAPAGPRPAPAPDELAVLQYTGGTTGTPKAAMLTHGNLSSNVQQVAAWFFEAVPGREVLVGALPFFHAFGMTTVMNFAVFAGAAALLVPDPRDIAGLAAAIARHRATIFPGVPQMFAALADSPAARRHDLSSLSACFSGGAPLPRPVLERFEAGIGGRLIEGYGLTEASPVTHANPVRGRRKSGSIGVPLPGTDMRLAALDGGAGAVGPGAEGELLVRGPQVMAGYWRRPDETAAALADGWLHTGDIARIDEDGYCYIAGRKKDMIIAGGYNVYPAEVDEVLMAHPAVAEAATIGVPDERRGETVKSFVVLRPGLTATAEELEAHCRRELAAYKIPRSIEFLDALPRSAIQKVLLRELRQRENAG